MKRLARLSAVLVLFMIAVGSVLAGGTALAADTGNGNPRFDSLTPAPFATVPPGVVLVGAHASSEVPLTSVTLSLNGSSIEQIGSDTETFLATSQQRVLTPGVYTASVAATDADGKEFQAQWDFIVSNDAQEGEWFSGNGTPKADQINATIRSLVEAFRWHLYGLSWDGANHPDLPSHVGLTGTGAPLTPWVTGTTFDQANTTATLKSLVEAFRWHFWGISWDGQSHCDVPTHADCHQPQPPQSIDPWFNASGQPIPANITATLRSLVESFRWHFWGYSWDGGHHPDIPTHATFDAGPVEGATLFHSSLTDVAALVSPAGSTGTPTANGYSLTVPPTVVDGISNSSADFGDASYSLTMRKVTPDGGAAGCLLFRIVDTPTGGLYEYCFVYSGNSTTAAHLLYLENSFDSNGAGAEDLALFTFDTPLPALSWNTLQVTAQGNNLRLYANGDYLGQVNHTGNTHGMIGFAVYNLETSTSETIEFTNLVVKAVPSVSTSNAGTASLSDANPEPYGWLSASLLSVESAGTR